MRRTVMVLMLAMPMIVLSASAYGEDIANSAKAYFKAGKNLFESGKYAEAAEAFRKANELKSSWKLYYNIGQCEALLKRHGLALQAFEQYLSEGGDDIMVERRDEVFAEVARLRKMVGVVEVDGITGDEIEINGVDRGALPYAGRIKVAMGNIDVVVHRHGEKVLKKSFFISGEETVKIVVTGEDEEVEPVALPAEKTEQVSPKEPTEPEPSASEETRPEQLSDEGEKESGHRTLALVSWSVGAAALIGGAVVGGAALSRYRDVEDTCDSDGYCSSGKKSEADSLRSMTITADVLFGVGAVGAVLGAIFFWVMGSDDEGDVEVGFAPTTDRQGARIGVSGSF